MGLINEWLRSDSNYRDTICRHVYTDEDEDTNENQTDTTGIPTHNEAFSAIENLRRFVSSRENVPYALHGFLNLQEDFITNEKSTSVNQRKITDFFNKNLM
ncbi:hypothetical protein QE152_g34863 [Popillia japonica]|uniref:Uncharacterized protein n=1 Tax=Popillia japonica TaxID=7064 RepID=A0AAW1IT86_POPJA